MNHRGSPSPDGRGIPKPTRAMFPMPSPLDLTRNGSAPGSFLSGVADSVIAGVGAAGFPRRIYPGEHPSTASESSSRSSASAVPFVAPDLEYRRSENASRKRSHGVPEAPVHEPESSVGGVSRILRHSSSPAGFLSHLMLDNGFSFSRDFGSCSQPGIEGTAGTGLKSQLGLSRRGIPDTGGSVGCSYNSDVTSGSVTQSYTSSNFSISSCGDTNAIIFSPPSSKRIKNNDEEIIIISDLKPQFSLPSTTLEMATMDKYLEFQHDQVPFKVQAKRGCATHPRSIAERERRTRISEKLKRLQELVPNRDKQTNTADMLDLVVEHIKGLQDQVRRFTELEYLILGLISAAPAFLIPLLIVGKADSSKCLKDRYWVKANLWMIIFSYVGNYFWTHYFFTVLGASYTFPSWRMNNVPHTTFLLTHSCFLFYHMASNMTLRRLRHLLADMPQSIRLASEAAWILALSYFIAYLETLAISNFPYYEFIDRESMYKVGSLFYAIYFLVSFPMFSRVDEKDDQPWDLPRVAVDALGAAMLVTIILDLWRIFLGPIAPIPEERQCAQPGLAWFHIPESTIQNPRI